MINLSVDLITELNYYLLRRELIEWILWHNTFNTKPTHFLNLSYALNVCLWFFSNRWRTYRYEIGLQENGNEIAKVRLNYDIKNMKDSVLDTWNNTVVYAKIVRNVWARWVKT